MGNDGTDRFSHHAAAVARELWGEENRQLSSAEELRFGRQGSISVALKTGQFFDHQEGEGGGVLWAIEHVTGQTVAGGHAINWMRSNGFDIEDTNPPPRPANSSGGARLDPDGNWLPQRVPDHGRLTKTYDYRDANGDLSYQVCRYDWTVDPAVNQKGHEKTFVQRRPDASKRNGWAYKMEGVEWLPYRLPELLEDVAEGCTIFVVEGEKKVDMLRDLGIPATCNHGGAGKFPEELVQHFKGADVVLMPDNDPQARDKHGNLRTHSDGRPVFPGKDHMDLVGRRLEGTAKRIRTLELPGLPEKGGVDDWLPAGGTAEQLYELAEQARPFEAAPFESIFGAVPWDQLDAPGPAHEYLIKGVLTRGEQSMLLGESQSGKSFVAVDMAMAVARGIDFFGRRTRQGGVIYQAGESAVGIRRRRLPAYRIDKQCADERLPFVLLERPLDLFTDDEHMELFIEECRHWSKTFGATPLELIVIDTFNKATPGANENDGKDMGVVLARCDRIRRETGAHVMLVHHLNAGGTKARGHTSLFANVENVISVRRVEDSHDTDDRPIREWKIAKAKEGGDGITTKFVLRQVEIGRDEDDDAITSCVIQKPNGGREAAPSEPTGIVMQGVNAVVLRAIYNAVAQRAVWAPKELGLSQGWQAVERTELWEEIRAQIPDEPGDKKKGESDDDAKKRRDATRRQQVKRAMDHLFAKKVIGRRDEWTWLTGKEVRGFEEAPGIPDSARKRRGRGRDQMGDFADLPPVDDGAPVPDDLPFDAGEF